MLITMKGVKEWRAWLTFAIRMYPSIDERHGDKLTLGDKDMMPREAESIIDHTDGWSALTATATWFRTGIAGDVLAGGLVRLARDETAASGDGRQILARMV